MFKTDRFEYRKVNEPPEGYYDWQRANRELLKRSKVSLDLDDTAIELIVILFSNLFQEPKIRQPKRVGREKCWEDNLGEGRL